MPTSMTTAPGLDHVGGDETRLADGGDQDVGAPGVEGLRSFVCEWQTVTVAPALHQQHRHRLADDVRAADDDRFLAAQIDAGLFRTSS
jgi:hypothetical protein